MTMEQITTGITDLMGVMGAGAFKKIARSVK